MSCMKIQSSQHMYTLLPKYQSWRIGLFFGLHTSKDNEEIKHLTWL